MNAGAFGGEGGVAFDDAGDRIGVAETDAEFGAGEGLSFGPESYKMPDRCGGQNSRGFGNTGDIAGEHPGKSAVRRGEWCSLHPCAGRQMHAEPW